MMRSMPPLMLMAIFVAFSSPAGAQTLSARPALFADPVLGVDPSRGELVLGQTTLTTALRIFAVELQDSVRVPLAHPSNPDTVGSATRLPGVADLRLRYRLDLGPSLYTLYFDANQRLVAAVTHRFRLPRPLRRDELVARYPTLKVARVGRTDEGVWLRDELVASIGPCVSVIADVWRSDKGQVGNFGYAFTCPTKPVHLPGSQ
jgi:hypothetical protein